MKKHRILKCVFVLICVLVSSNSWAEWTGRQTVFKIYPGTTAMYIQTDPSSAHINPDGCSSATHYRLDPELMMYEKHYELLVSALISNRQVSLRIQGCLGSNPVITGVSMY